MNRSTWTLFALPLLFACSKSGPQWTGTWKGEVTEGAEKYPAVVTFEGDGAKIHYGKPFDCNGTWTPKKSGDGAQHYDEKILTQGHGKRCLDGGDVTITKAGSDLHFVWGNNQAQADLKPAK